MNDPRTLHGRAHRSRSFAPLLALAIATACALSPAVARADNATAQALFEEGRKLMLEGRFGDACPKLAASQKLDPGAGTLMNLASCYEKNGQLASAWATFKDAAAAARTSAHPDWEKAARDRAGELEPRLSRLTIVVAPEADVPGLVIERDGQPVDRAEWGVALPIDPGVHPIEAQAPKKQKWSTTVSVGPNGAKASVAVPALTVEQGDARPSSGPPPPLAPDSVDRGATTRVLGYGLAGLGVVGLGVGSIFGLIASATHKDALTHCTADRCCTREGIDLGDRASSQATVSTVAFVAGGALAAAGVVLVVTAPKAPASQVAISIAPTPAGASLSVGGGF